MIKKLFVLFVLIFSIIGADANPIKDLIRNSGNSKNYPKDDLLIIFDSTKVDVQETGLSYVNFHALYKILTTKGAKRMSVVKFDYDPLSAFVEIRKVVIYRKSGKIEELDVSNELDYPAPARMIYWGARQKMLEIGRLETGDAVEVFMFRKGFTYALLQENGDEQYIPPMRGHFYDIVNFWSSDPIITKFYQTKIPENKFVQYKFYNGDVDSLIQKMDGKIAYSFTKKNISKIKREPGMVALSDIAPKLLISTSPDWEAKSQWFYGVNEDFGSFNSTPEIDKKIKEILQAATNELDSISKLTHWVADNMRYSGISMGKGEGYTLHSGEMNFTDRCGVCKDKASLLITFLRAAGFESYAAMTMAGSRIDRIPADQFNHSVTIVKLKNGKYKILDPTWVPFVRELWSSREQQQNYLMGLPDGADLMETPISAAENHYYKIIGISELFADGTMKGEFTLEAEGQSDAAFRGGFVRTYYNYWYGVFEKELMKISPNIKIIEMNIPDFYDYSDPLKMKFKYEIPNYAIVTNEEIIFTPIVASNLFKRFNSYLYTKTDVEERKYNFRSSCSKLIELNEEIKLPAFAESTYLPEAEKVEGSGADYTGNYKIENQTLKLNEKIVLKKRIYEPADWDSYKKAIESQNKFANEPVILKIK